MFCNDFPNLFKKLAKEQNQLHQRIDFFIEKGKLYLFLVFCNCVSILGYKRVLFLYKLKLVHIFIACKKACNLTYLL